MQQMLQQNWNSFSRKIALYLPGWAKNLLSITINPLKVKIKSKPKYIFIVTMHMKIATETLLNITFSLVVIIY